VRSSDFDIRWWIRYLHEYQEDKCEDFTSAVDALRASPGFVFVYSCVYLAFLIAHIISHITRPQHRDHPSHQEVLAWIYKTSVKMLKG
jgi:hypothetical protein